MKAQGAAIVEVNAGPGLLMHLKPATGNRVMGRAIAARLLQVGVVVRGPVHLIAWLLHLQGLPEQACLQPKVCS
jgi:cyanophycin synthetase